MLILDTSVLHFNGVPEKEVKLVNKIRGSKWGLLEVQRLKMDHSLTFTLIDHVYTLRFVDQQRDLVHDQTLLDHPFPEGDGWISAIAESTGKVGHLWNVGSDRGIM